MRLIGNADVDALLTSAACIDVIEDAYVEWGHGRAAQYPPGGRMDLVAPSPGPEAGRRFTWGAMAGVVPKLGVFAVRQKLDIHFQTVHPDGRETIDRYCIDPGTRCGFILLAATADAEPLAIIKDGALQPLRVAATAAVAARRLAREDASVLAIIGSGGMARGHAQALAGIRPIREIRVFSPTPQHRESFAARTAEELGVHVTATNDASSAVCGADIVAMCTSSTSPIFDGTDWIEPGMHITGVVPAEVGSAPLAADTVVLHQRGGVVQEVAHGEGVDPAHATRAFEGSYGELDRARPGSPTLRELVTGHGRARSRPDEVTYFHNLPGSGIQFAAVGAKVYELATAVGAGVDIPTEWFLQDAR